jgi:hypothetical protein
MYLSSRLSEHQPANYNSSQKDIEESEKWARHDSISKAIDA